MERLRDLVRREPKRGFVLPGWIERLVSVGIVTEDPQLKRRQCCANVAAYATALNAGGHLVVNSFHNFDELFLINIYNLIVTVLALAAPRLHRYSANAAAYLIIAIVLCGTVFVVFALGITSDLHIYLTLAGAMLFLFGVQAWRLFLGFFVVFVVVLLLLLIYAPIDGFVLPEDGQLREMLSRQALLNTIVINAAMIFYALSALRQAEVELETQYERSEALVSTVMPAPIAARLKSGSERIADGIDNLSVLFADIVDYTGAARNLSPEEVVGYLDELVRTFDALAAAHGVEKIKTIGDRYMAVAGLDGRGRDGAVALGRFGFALLDAVARLRPIGGRKLEMRVGIHCGPAVAGVIGDTRFSYDVWGDAVNVASRMESHGVPGRIQVSEEFRALAGDAFGYEERGPTELKGIGEAKTWFLVERPSPAHASRSSVRRDRPASD